MLNGPVRTRRYPGKPLPTGTCVTGSTTRAGRRGGAATTGRRQGRRRRGSARRSPAATRRSEHSRLHPPVCIHHRDENFVEKPSDLALELGVRSRLSECELVHAGAHDGLEQVERAHCISERKPHAVRHRRVSLAEVIDRGRVLLVWLARVLTQQPHEVVTELTLLLFGRLVEAR